jgi:hypothetical protein
MRIKQHSNSKWFQKKQSRHNNLKSPKSLPENPQPSSQKSLWLGTKDAKHLALI